MAQHTNKGAETMRTMNAIQKTNGQWWTGACWGVEQARELYKLDDIPLEIDGLEYEAHCEEVYYDSNDEPIASVVKVRLDA